MHRLAVSFFCLAILSTAAWAGGDAAKGEQAFKKCKACHSAEDATNKVGPSLKGVVGRVPGTVEGYNYSDAMKAFGAAGNVWDVEKLDTYLTDPRAFVAGNKMTFAGVKNSDERQNIIAYLKTKM